MPMFKKQFLARVEKVKLLIGISSAYGSPVSWGSFAKLLISPKAEFISNRIT